MPMFKIYVGNLDPRVKIEHVRELFSPFATIEDAVIADDPATGKSKGFAIIMIRDAEIGRAAVKATQGKRLFGKTLTINEVMKKGKATAKTAKDARQGPFGPHFNRVGGPRVGTRNSGRRGFNRGPRTGFAPGSGGVGSPPRGLGGPGTGDASPLGGSGLGGSGPRSSPGSTGGDRPLQSGERREPDGDSGGRDRSAL